MKIDLEYFSDFLAIFINSENAHVNYNDFKNSHLEVNQNNSLSEKFIFHIQLALDNQLLGTISGTAFNLKDLGLTQYADGDIAVAVMPWRLTQKGHDFASSLNNKEVLMRLKSEFKDAPFKVIFDSGQKLLEHFMKKKLDDLLEQ